MPMQMQGGLGGGGVNPPITGPNLAQPNLAQPNLFGANISEGRHNAMSRGGSIGVSGPAGMGAAASVGMHSGGMPNLGVGGIAAGGMPPGQMEISFGVPNRNIVTNAVVVDAAAAMQPSHVGLAKFERADGKGGA